MTAGGLVFIGATSFDKKFRAFDKATGERLWEATLPFSGTGTPATYEVAGRQFVVVPAGGGKDGGPTGGLYVAFALPALSGSDACDAVDLDERVARDPAGRGDRRADARLRAKAAEEGLVHRRVVLQVVQIHVHLQHLLHRGADILEPLLDLVEHVLGVGLDVAFEVRADAGDEDEFP